MKPRVRRYTKTQKVIDRDLSLTKMDRNQNIVKLYEEDGMSYDQIAEKYGVSRQRISQIYHKYK